jgi:hypothetical protein
MPLLWGSVFLRSVTIQMQLMTSSVQESRRFLITSGRSKITFGPNRQIAGRLSEKKTFPLSRFRTVVCPTVWDAVRLKGQTIYSECEYECTGCPLRPQIER